LASDNVIDLDRPKSSLLDAIGRAAAKPERAPGAEPVEAPAPTTPNDSLISVEELSPLPQAEDAYEAHSRIQSRPQATIFFLPKSQLPDGFSYATLERVRLVEGTKAGESPYLLLRFNGSVVCEVRIDGRNLLGLCNLIGRHAILWIREHPTGRDDGNDRAVFIRRITPREIERE
jgi:hypothetical protein